MGRKGLRNTVLEAYGMYQKLSLSHLKYPSHYGGGGICFNQGKNDVDQWYS